ncbi:MAG: VWA domain-containing protein [Phycisphaerae bacterium]
MRSRYFEFNGKPFRLQGDLGLTENFFDFILAHGDEALRALQHLERDPEHADLLKRLLEQGMLEKAKGRFRLTPRAVNAMQRKALMEAFAQLKKGVRDGHVSPEFGGGGERVEGTRPLEFGDPVSEIDLGATMRNAIRRTTQAQAALEPKTSQAPDPNRDRQGAGDAGRLGPPRCAMLPLRFAPADFERHNSESRASCSTVVLLDMSGSMARFGRFFQAKKCAMSLYALIRQRFPLDTVDLVGFFSGAEAVAQERLPLLMPKAVTMYDPSIRLQVPLKKLDQAPQHFTNLHMGLLLARRLLARRSGDNKLMFIITDGQPTAHVQGEYAHLIYPPHKSSHVATLKEAFLIARGGVRICTFALTDDYWDMDWLGFVDDLGRLTRGVTFHCASGDLSSCVMESYLSGRKRKTFIA